MTEVSTAPTTPKIKVRLPYQRACNEKNEKGKICAGHLKRWYGASEDTKKQVDEFLRSEAKGGEAATGSTTEIYRCEYCHTLYLPAPGFHRRSGTLQF